MRGVVGRVDAVLAAGFVVAAAGEALALHRDTPGLLAFGLGGAPLLAVLAVRRSRPVLPICVVAAFAVLGVAVQAALWPDTEDSGGIWMIALLLGAYSLGAHGHGRVVALGGLLPLLVVLAADLPAMRGWALVNGVVFVTMFIGVLPTAVGRLVRVRRERLVMLREQRDRIVREQRAQRESAALTERLRATERLRPALLDGLRALAERAERGGDPGEIESSARRLLGRTREEVVALTAPVDVPASPLSPPADHLRLLRAAGQRWTVLVAGAIATGLVLEAVSAPTLRAPVWVAVLAGLAIGVALAQVWWRPLPALAVAWCATAAFSRLVAPLDGTLSGSALALAAAFAVAALSTRPTAVAGLALCWLGQGVGVGTDDPFGEAVIILVCWLGGLAVSETSRLVEQTRTNNRLLAGDEAAAAQRAVVDERLRLAREIHDQLGHSLTVVALQAGAARRLATTDPERAQAVMATIAAAARDGVTGLAAAGASADLGALLERTRAAGLRVEADLGDLGLLDTEHGAVAYRLVQEALTNVLRHAPGAAARVVVRRAGDGVVVRVLNSAPTRAGSGPGTSRGLTGIRERVSARAGRVVWGPSPDGGYEVRAVLPIAGAEGAGT